MCGMCFVGFMFRLTLLAGSQKTELNVYVSCSTFILVVIYSFNSRSPDSSKKGKTRQLVIESDDELPPPSKL